MKGLTRMMIIVALTLLPLAAFAGDPDTPPGPPASGSGMPTLQELYNYLTSGTEPSAPGAFQEPGAGPGSTMATLQEIYEAFKALIDQCAATPADVRSGVTFFSTESSSWGPQTGTGTMAVGPPAPVEKTGQTTSCGTGDDGALQKGVAWPSPRFTANVDNNNDGDCVDPGETCDGTVTDNLTGLIWLKNANCFGLRDWTTALSDANGLASGSCGLTDGSSAGDWRLPNVKELQSLIDYGRFNPAFPSGHPFTGVQSYYYWSSTASAGITGYAWYVYLSYGYVYHYRKTYAFYVWPVRGGE